MALPATLVYEIRPTNGTANAGGGFDPSVTSPGTDFSQQNAVQIAYTDLVIGATATQLTSALNPFTSAHVGNNIAITGGTGFTQQIFNVRSVSGVTATMDRAVGTASSTGGTGNLGGARNGLSTGTRTVQLSLVSGNIVWVKNEAWNEAITLSVAGATTTPIVIQGYDTTRWVNEALAPKGSTRPLNNRASAGTNGISITGGSVKVKYIMVTAAGTNGFNVGNVGGVTFEYCRSYSNGGAGWNIATNNDEIFVACEADLNTGVGIGSAFAGDAFCCNIHNNTGGGILSNGAFVSAIFTVTSANANAGISGPGSDAFFLNCTSNGNTGASSDGLFVDGARVIVLNNIFSNNGRNGVFCNTLENLNSVDYNNFFGNVTARTNFPVGPNDLALDPQFVNTAGGNFAIGTNLRGKAFPGLLPGGTSTGYLDIGAIQRQEPQTVMARFV